MLAGAIRPLSLLPGDVCWQAATGGEILIAAQPVRMTPTGWLATVDTKDSSVPMVSVGDSASICGASVTAEARHS
jgi:hypothetical protein